MFEDLRKTLHGKLANKNNNGEDNDLFPVLTAQALLASEQRQQLLSKILEAAQSLTDDYNGLYLTTLHQFAEFVQSLPEIEHGAYFLPGDFLDHALERVALALPLANHYLTSTENPIFSQKASLWLYALFTVALLKDIGKIVDQFTVILCTPSGKALAEWNPFAGSMVGQASHYQFTYTTQHFPRVRKAATFYFARQLLPEAGFNWLASDNAVFDGWLAMFEDEARHLGTLVSLIPVAEAQLINKRLKQYLEPSLLGHIKLPGGSDSDITASSSSTHIRPAGLGLRLLPPTKLQQIARENALIYDFLAWLKKRLSEKNKQQAAYTVNQLHSEIHHVAEGLLITPKVVQDFAKENKQNPLYRDWKTIYNQLIKFGLPGGTADTAAYRYLNQENAKKLVGAIINPYLILPKTAVPPLNPFLIKISQTMTSRALGNYISKPFLTPPKPKPPA
jgi:hypothetical protein